MTDVHLRKIVKEHGAEPFVAAINAEIKRQKAPIRPMTKSIMRDMIYLTFRPLYGVWMLAGMRRLGYSVPEAVAAYPKLKPFALAAIELAKEEMQ